MLDTRTSGAVDAGSNPRWDQHNLDRRRRILRALVDLIEELPAGTHIPVQVVASRCGLAKSVLYRQFDGRDDLDRRARALIIRDFGRDLEAALDLERGPLIEVITRGVQSVVDWSVRHPRLHEFIRSGPTHYEARIDAASSLTDQIAARIADALAEVAAAANVDIPGRRVAPFAMVTMVEGTVKHWIREPDPKLPQAELVAHVAGHTWHILEGLARDSGLVIDRQDTLADVFARLRS